MLIWIVSKGRKKKSFKNGSDLSKEVYFEKLGNKKIYVKCTVFYQPEQLLFIYKTKKIFFDTIQLRLRRNGYFSFACRFYISFIM